MRQPHVTRQGQPIHTTTAYLTVQSPIALLVIRTSPDPSTHAEYVIQDVRSQNTQAYFHIFHRGQRNSNVKTRKLEKESRGAVSVLNEGAFFLTAGLGVFSRSFGINTESNQSWHNKFPGPARKLGCQGNKQETPGFQARIMIILIQNPCTLCWSMTVNRLLRMVWLATTPNWFINIFSCFWYDEFLCFRCFIDCPCHLQKSSWWNPKKAVAVSLSPNKEALWNYLLCLGNIGQLLE